MAKFFDIVIKDIDEQVEIMLANPEYRELCQGTFAAIFLMHNTCRTNFEVFHPHWRLGQIGAHLQTSMRKLEEVQGSHSSARPGLVSFSVCLDT